MLYMYGYQGISDQNQLAEGNFHLQMAKRLRLACEKLEGRVHLALVVDAY